MGGGPITCGEATIRLLARYGVDTVFGIPGVHTLDFCRGLADGSIRLVRARNEQGAGFMADGYARTTGRPGVALVISGPGVTNALTPIGQSWADSVPVLLVSSETDSATHGRGWGALHEIPDQRAVTAPLTALSLRATEPDDVPRMMADAFAVFGSRRPRPVHLSIPIDVLAMPVSDDWDAVEPPPRPSPDAGAVDTAAKLLASARQPVLMVGGGAVDAAEPARALVEMLAMPVLASNAGKGIVPDDHPLSLGGSIVRPEAHRWLGEADVVLAVGTELAETDSFVERLPITGSLVRVDIDEAKIDDLYRADVGIVSDAAPALSALVDALDAAGVSYEPATRAAREARVADVRREIAGALTESEAQHARLLAALDEGLDDDVVFLGDVCQIVYTGGFAMPRRRPRTWSYAAGYCTLGCGLPNAIGAKLAMPERDIVCLAGDGGFMFTVQELIVATEEGLGIPIVIWDNDGLKQIRDDMTARGVPHVGVTGRNPDFLLLAASMGADGVVATSLDHVVEEVTSGFAKDRPTVILVHEGEPWLGTGR